MDFRIVTRTRRVQISNNLSRVNGWTNHARIHGICRPSRRLGPWLAGRAENVTDLALQ
jgi:hypothetical protein